MILFYKLAPVRILTNGAPASPDFLPRGWEGLSDPVLVQSLTGYPLWVNRAALEARSDPDWSLQAPTRPGTYRWRKNYQWEPITRDVKVASPSSEWAGQLVTFAHRYGHEVPLNRLEGGGSEWFGVDLISGGFQK
jgi:hypothetical protein